MLSVSRYHQYGSDKLPNELFFARGGEANENFGGVHNLNLPTNRLGAQFADKEDFSH